MPQRRGWRQPKQDHSVYVQQLFRDFLARNSEIPNTAAPNNARTNFSRPESDVTEQRKQPGIFDRAVYARFERNTNSGSFVRQEPTNRSKTGLMRWIDKQRNNRQQRNVPVQKASRSDDYLNLPDNFFSCTEHMKLPFEVADKTLANVTNNFVPPATSTPFDRMASFGVSGVLSDPAELQSSSPVFQQSSCTKSSDWEMFLKNCDKYFTGATKEHECASELIHQRKEMANFLKTDETSVPIHLNDQPDIRIETIPAMASKQDHIVGESPRNSRDTSLMIGHNPSRNSPERDVMSLEAMEMEMEIPNPFPVIPNDPNQDPILTKQKKRNNVTFLIEPNSQSKFNPCSGPSQGESSQEQMLLTASPPSPTMSSSRRRCLYEESTFLLDRVPSDDTLMQKLDALLEEEEFNIHGENTEHEFDLCTPTNQPTMNITFPSQLQVMNNPADDSIMANAEFPNTPLYLSQDLMMAPTMQDFREALF